MNAFNNLQDMLDHYGVDTPHSLGRSFYKNISCGPWIAFIVPDKPARTECAHVEVRVYKGHLRARVESPTPKNATKDALRFCGFDADGLNRAWSSLDAYERRVEKFMRSDPKDGAVREWVIQRLARCIGCVRLEISRTIPAVSTSIYYEDKAAFSALPGCIAVTIGSIVEGWDGELEPTTLEFPFTPADVDHTLTELNDTCSRIWDWANVTYDKLGRRHRHGKTAAELGVDCPI